jgi:hypothetical protein
VTLIFKSNTTYHYDFHYGTLTNIENDLLGPLDPPFRKYSYHMKDRTGSVTVNLREIAAVLVEK